MQLRHRSIARGALGTWVAAATLLGAMALPAGVASAATSRSATPTGTYLALGDSVAFGYVPSNATPPPNYNVPSSFIGYPEDLGRSLNLSVVNASCPGETTMSFLAVGAQSNGCENSVGSPIGYRTVYPLHV